MPSLSPVALLPEVTVPLNRFVPPGYEHYFNGQPDRPYYLRRRFDFVGLPMMMPLVRAFLDTCAAEHDREFRYLFTLLGNELASNAIKHSRSGQSGGTYSLIVRRHPDGLTLTCRDEGDPDPDSRWNQRQHTPHLHADPTGLDPTAEAGRGLALINALASSWGDNAHPALRQVWFHLTDISRTTDLPTTEPTM